MTVPLAGILTTKYARWSHKLKAACLIICIPTRTMPLNHT